MGFVSNPAFDTDVSLDFYIRKTPKINRVLISIGSTKFDNMCQFAYFILDPRSDYYDETMSKESRINMIIEDFPEYKDFIEDDNFLIILNHINKLYKSSVRDKLIELGEQIKKSNELVHRFNDEMTAMKLDKDSVSILKNLADINAKHLTLFTEYRKEFEAYLRFTRTLEDDIVGNQLSVLEKWHHGSIK